MKKIGLFLDFEPSGGGTFQYGLSMLEALIEIPGIELKVIYTHPAWNTWIKKYSVDSQFVQQSFFWRASWYLWRRLHLSVRLWRKVISRLNPMARKIYAEGFDLVIFPSQDLWSVQLDVNAMVSVHDLMHLYESQFEEVSLKGEHSRRQFTYSNIARFARAILVDSEVGKKQMNESYRVQGAVFTLPFIAPDYVRAHTVYGREQLPFSLPEKYLFYPAQFWTHKNHLRLLEAVSALKRKGQEINLVFCGSKKNGSDGVQAFVKEHSLEKNVIFLNYVEDQYMASLYFYSSGLVFPTFFGPTNIPPLEAAWMNRPMAVSAIYGMPEQLGASALWFDPKSLPEMGSAIERLWNSGFDAEQMKEARMKVKASTTPEQFRQKLSAALLQLQG